MEKDHLSRRICSYESWKADMAETVARIRGWLDEHQLSSHDHAKLLDDTIESLRSDRLTLAFVGEFSRGKTELINAIFFSEHGQRLLPAEVGRTTMCPTELFYDNDADAAYMRLLPIRTRLDNRSIAELKKDRDLWTEIPLDLDSAGQVSRTLREVAKSERVTVGEACSLGLCARSADPQHSDCDPPAREVEIPRWRHAMISYPHHLLRRGLVILDTPGLNALGSEPELTLTTLPAAQGVLFVLAADTGVTASDLYIWQHHISGVRAQSSRGLLVVLNKIDTLWDELRATSSVDDSIESQRFATAAGLNVGQDQVYPVSAQKALLAKIRQNEDLLERSRIATLEDCLSDHILTNKQDLVRESVLQRIGPILDENSGILSGRLDQTTIQIRELHSLRGKSADFIQQLLRRSREEQTAYIRNVDSFQASRRVLQAQARALLHALSMDTLDNQISRTRHIMSNSWTTVGLKRGMASFFDGARNAMREASSQAEQTRRLITATYRKFHEEHGLPELVPKVFSLYRYSLELDSLYADAETFRNSPVTLMTEQGFVTRKFFMFLVSHSRSLFLKANQEAASWLRQVMNPLINQIMDHKQMMQKQLEALRRISESRQTLDARIVELEELQKTLNYEITALETFREQLYRPLHTLRDRDLPDLEEASA